jgi:peptide/nickel transport system substrate-binding protein
MKIYRYMIAVVSVAVLTLSTTAIASAAGSSHATGTKAKEVAHATIQRGGTLVFDRTGDILTLDPTQAVENESIWADECIYEGLYQATKNGKELVPDMATTYSLSKNNLSWTFNLRHGVEFSNGQEMTSADVKFSILRVSAKASNPWVFINADIKSITTPSKFQVVITTKTPWAPLLAVTALFANGIIPDNYAGESPSVFWQHPIATGPFMVKTWLKGDELELVRNPHYWQHGKPYLNGVDFVSVPDDNTRLLQLQSGVAQIEEYPPWSQVDELSSMAGITMGLFPSSWVQFLSFNEQIKYFKDVHVRLAISYAIDRAAIVKAVLYGHGTVANSLVSSAMWDYDPSTPGAQYNPAKAKKEMAESAYPKGFTTKVLVGAGDQNELTMGEIIQSELAPLGIHVTLQEVSGSAESTDIETGQYQMSVPYYTTDIIDPDELMAFLASGTAGEEAGFTWYNNATVDNLVAEAEHVSSVPERKKLYDEAQVILAQDPPDAYLFYEPYAYAYSNKVHGFYPYPTGNYHLENVWISK